MGSHAPRPSAPDGLSLLLPLPASHPVSPSLESYVPLWGVSIYSVAGRHWEGGDPTLIQQDLFQPGHTWDVSHTWLPNTTPGQTHRFPLFFFTLRVEELE